MEKFFEADGSIVLMFFYKPPISEEGENVVYDGTTLVGHLWPAIMSKLKNGKSVGSPTIEKPDHRVIWEIWKCMS